jgi:AraC family transcriptional regulator
MTFEPTRFADGRPMLLAGIRRHHRYADAPRDIPKQWEAFVALGTLPGQQGATTYGAMCGNDPAAQTFEYMCAAEVADFAAVPPSLGRMRVPAQRYAVFTHRGPVPELRATWDAIWNDWLPRSGHEPADTPDFERYDPATDEIEIWFPVRPTFGALC